MDYQLSIQGNQQTKIRLIFGFSDDFYTMRKILPGLLLLAVVHLTAQTKYTISGYVRESGSLETLPGVSVVNMKSKAGTVTNNYGFYSLTQTADSVDFYITYVGYVPYRVKFLLTRDTTITVDLQTVELETVVITDQQTEKISEGTQMSTVSIPVEQIKTIPALLGEKDVLKVVQLMPGVHSGNEGSSGFYVRGGGADQNLIILDDATVYNAYHLFGFFSIFNGDALKSVELTKGGFPARYGGRLSSVLEMQMKEGNKQEFHGEAGIGLISSRATFEGPIIKGRSSFLVSGRRTYIDALIYPFLPADNKFGYYFEDFNAKVNYDLNPNNRLYLSGYFGKDKFYAKFNAGQNYSDKAAMGWGNITSTLRWNHLWNDRLFSNTSFIFTDYNLEIGYEEHYNNDLFSLNYSSGIRDFSLKHDFDFAPGPNHFIKFGIISTYHRFSPSAIVVKSSYEPDNLFKQSILEAYESGIYFEDDWTIVPRLKVNVGFRLSHFYTQKKNYLRPEPRIAARFMIDENSSIKACFTIMNQYLHLLSNTGIGLPTDLWVPATKNVAPQSSWQTALGYARDIPKYKLMISAEAYYKHSTDVLGYKDGASFLLIGDPTADDGGVQWEKNVTSGQGWSYGFEFLVQKKVGKFTGWVGYTLSWTTLQFDSLNFGKKYYARYDRRNDVSVVGIYKVNDHITISATWVFGTGAAITLPLADYVVAEHDPLGGQTNQPANMYNWFVNDYGEKNSFRMAPYHRADIGVQFHKQMKHWERTFELSFYNVYNRKNPFFYYIGYNNFSNQRVLKQVSLFPIIPSVSWNIKF